MLRINHSTSKVFSTFLKSTPTKALPKTIRNKVVNATNHFVFPSILDNFDAIFVEYKPMETFVQDHLEWSKPVYTFSPIFQSELSKQSDGKDVQIVIPGLITSSNRDYNTVLSAFSNIFDRDLGVRLVLLGSPVGSSGQRIVKIVKRMKKNGCEIDYYTEWIDHGDFEQTLSDSDIILNPLRVKKPNPQYYKILRKKHEIRGTTQGSGPILDAIRHGLPLIVPSEFQVSDNIKGFSVQYDSETQLVDTISNLATQPDILREKTNIARRVSEEYNLERRAHKFRAIIDEIRDSNQNSGGPR
jgi:glycosyltransferase involved in cell wall biosynthesis